MLTRNEQIEVEETPSAAPTPAVQPKPRGGFLAVVLGAIRALFQFILMAAVLFGGYWMMNHFTSLKQEPPSRPPFKTVYTVDSTIARYASHQPKIKVYGEVQASKSVELRSLVAGPVIAVNPDLKVGSRVEKGAELFRIDPFPFERELAAARANIAETMARIEENKSRIEIERSDIGNLKEQLELAEKDLERIAALRQRGTATARDVETRSLTVSQRKQALQRAELNVVAEQNRLSQQEAILERLKWSEMQAERNLGDTVFKAPLGGVVSEKNVSEGRLLNANDMAVAMYEADRMEVRFTLTDQRFGRIQSDRSGVIGRPVEVIWNVGGQEFRYDAVIDRIGAQITSNRGGVEVIAIIREDVTTTALRPGAFVELIVPDREFENHFQVPETALYDGNTVYVIRDGEIAAHTVTLHAFDGDQVILSGDVAEGDEIMTTRIAEISNGLRVRPPDVPRNTDAEGDKSAAIANTGQTQ